MKKILIFCFYLISILDLNAQQVINIETKRYDTRDSSWHGDVELNFNYIQNRNTVVNFGNKLNFILKRDVNTYLFLSDFNFLQSNSRNLDYASYQHFRFKRELKPWLSGEAFAQTQFNQQIGLNFRGLLGAGPRFRLFFEDSMKMFLGPMWMYEYESTTDTEAKNVHNRLSLYLSFLYFKTRNFNFDLVAYYQPDLIDFSNFRFSSEAKVEMHFTNHLSFRFSISQNYNSIPPPNIPKNIANVRNAFVYKF